MCAGTSGFISESFIMKNRNIAAALVPVLAVLGSQAHAAVSEAFTASVTSVSADIAVYGGALITIAAVGVAFMVGMKYVKKISRAA